MRKLLVLAVLLIPFASFSQTVTKQGYENMERVERGGLRAEGSLGLPVKENATWLGKHSDLYRSSIDSGIWFYDPVTDTDKPVIRTDAGGKIPLQYISDALLGAVNYQGTYSPATNTPTLPGADISNKGWYFVASDSGVVGGITYRNGDWIISDGTTWGKVDNTGKVTSVFGRTGAVSAQSGDYTAAQVTGAIAQGGNSFDGSNMVIGTDDAGFLQLKQNGSIRMIFSGANIYGPTASAAFGYISLGASQGVPAFNVSKNATTGDATIMTVNNLSSTSNGNFIDFSSNIGGTTAVRASVAKDGSITAPNIVYKTPADYGGSLSLGTSTNNAVSISVNNNVIATFTNAGIRCSAGITHSTNLNNGGLVFSSGTPTISRNLADATTAFIVDNVHTSNTGNITEFKKAGTTVASIDNSGNITAPNIQYTDSINSVSLTLTAPGYYTNTGAAVTYTVPTPTNVKGRMYTITNMGSASITLAAGFEDMWEAGVLKTSVSVPAGGVKAIRSNGAKWVVVYSTVP